MTPDDHANTVREAIEEAQGADFDAGRGPAFTRVLYAKRIAALDDLQAQAELEIARLQAVIASLEPIIDAEKARAEAAEQRAADMQAERDFLLSDPDNVAIKEWRDRLEAERNAAEQRATDMEKALRLVRENAKAWHGPDGLDTGHAHALAVIAGWCDAVLSAREEAQT